LAILRDVFTFLKCHHWHFDDLPTHVQK
jgi:hypothetical protein